MHQISYTNTDKVRTHAIHGVLNGADVLCIAKPGEEVTFFLDRHDFDIIPFEADGRLVIVGGEVLTWHDVLTFDRDALGPDHPSNKIDVPSITMKNANDVHDLCIETKYHETKIMYKLAPKAEAALVCHSIESTYPLDENGEPIPQDIPPHD